MSLRYLLDANILSALINNPAGTVATHAISLPADTLATSIIVTAELYFGLENRQSERLAHQIAEVLGSIEILAFEAPADRLYGRIRAELARRGTPIGANDLLIAAHALSLDLILATDNIREFERVKGLKVENWLRN